MLRDSIGGAGILICLARHLNGRESLG